MPFAPERVRQRLHQAEEGELYLLVLVRLREIVIPPGNISATLTGKVLEKKKGKQLRVNGSVSILDFNYPPRLAQLHERRAGSLLGDPLPGTAATAPLHQAGAAGLYGGP